MTTVSNTKALPNARVALTVRLLAATAAFVAVAAFLYFRSPLVVDIDGLYHYHHADIYRTHGLFFHSFPWLTASVIRTHPGDLWYGFHLLLAPFTAFSDPVFGLKIAGIFVLTLSLLLALAASLIRKFRFPYLWPFVMLFATGDELTRLVSVRPQVLSMGIVMLIAAATAEEIGWLAALSCGLLAFIHLNLAWLGLVVVALQSVASRLAGHGRENATNLGSGHGNGDATNLPVGQNPSYNILGWSIVGTLAGWLLRPHAIDTAYLLYVQLVALAIDRSHGIYLSVGKELFPMPWLAVRNIDGLFAILWLGSGLLVWRTASARAFSLRPSSKAFLGLVGSLSVAFFGAMWFAARRSSDQWVIFATLFIAESVTVWWGSAGVADTSSKKRTPARRGKAQGTRPPVDTRPSNVTSRGFAPAAVLFVTLCAIAGTSLYFNAAQMAMGRSPDRLRAACLWIRSHAIPGEIVFHPDWGTFPELFFWNDRVRYISGMDPVFSYSYSPDLYYCFDRLRYGDNTRYTSPSPPGPTFVPEDTFICLRTRFHASYVLFVESEQPGLYGYMLSDTRYLRVYDDGRAVVFQLLPVQ